MTEYKIVAFTERDDETGEPLWWNNEFGWGSFDAATPFTEDARRYYQEPADSRWVGVPCTCMDCETPFHEEPFLCDNRLLAFCCDDCRAAYFAQNWENNAYRPSAATSDEIYGD